MPRRGATKGRRPASCSLLDGAVPVTLGLCAQNSATSLGCSSATMHAAGSGDALQRAQRPPAPPLAPPTLPASFLKSSTSHTAKTDSCMPRAYILSTMASLMRQMYRSCVVSCAACARSPAANAALSSCGRAGGGVADGSS